MIEELRSKHPEEFREYKTKLAQVFKMQHYGLPTRIIDITDNPLIALHFAIENTEHQNKDGKVYIIKKRSDDIKKINLISLLPYITNNSDIEELIELYEKEFEEEITIKNIHSWLPQCIFHDSSYESHNNRSFIQGGNAIIFGSKITNRKICKTEYVQFNEDYIEGEIIIPSHLKRNIQIILSDKYGISNRTLYLNLQDSANQIKNLYTSREVDYSYETNINITEKNAIHTKINLDIILEKKYRLPTIRIIIDKVFEEIQYKFHNSKIFAYIYISEDDKRYFNWICMAFSKNLNRDLIDHSTRANIDWMFRYDSQRIFYGNSQDSSYTVEQKHYL